MALTAPLLVEWVPSPLPLLLLASWSLSLFPDVPFAAAYVFYVRPAPAQRGCPSDCQPVSSPFSFPQTAWLDGKHVVFGRVTEGLDVLDKIEAVKTASADRPVSEIVVTDCGVLPSA